MPTTTLFFLQNPTNSSFYKCFIAYILTFNFTAWFSSLTFTHRNTRSSVINRSSVIRISSKIIGQEQKSLSTIFNTRVMKKGNHIASTLQQRAKRAPTRFFPTLSTCLTAVYNVVPWSASFFKPFIVGLNRFKINAHACMHASMCVCMYEWMNLFANMLVMSWHLKS